MNSHSVIRNSSSSVSQKPPKDPAPLTDSKSLGGATGEFKPVTAGEPQKLEQPNASHLQPSTQGQTLQEPTATGVVAVTAEGGTPPGGCNDFEWSTGSSGEGVNETGSGTESVPVAPEKPQPENAAHADQNPAETPLPIPTAATQQPDTPDASDDIDEASLDTPPVAADDLKVANDKVAESSAALEANKKAIEQDTKMVAFMVNMQKFVDGLLTQYPKLTAEDLAPLRDLFQHAQQVCQQRLDNSMVREKTLSESLRTHTLEAMRLSELARGEKPCDASGAAPGSLLPEDKPLRNVIDQLNGNDKQIVEQAVECAHKIIDVRTSQADSSAVPTVPSAPNSSDEEAVVEQPFSHTGGSEVGADQQAFKLPDDQPRVIPPLPAPSETTNEDGVGKAPSGEITGQPPEEKNATKIPLPQLPGSEAYNGVPKAFRERTKEPGTMTTEEVLDYLDTNARKIKQRLDADIDQYRAETKEHQENIDRMDDERRAQQRISSELTGETNKLVERSNEQSQQIMQSMGSTPSTDVSPVPSKSSIVSRLFRR
ncbi:hypothetical protein [Hydrogenophaga intermedia]|uniref:hypothetical protein n=1 Tax=Hydrogenophaga intermedia TaxID=65786 RepID=UPI002044190B|nr:hypothetical protein [Hydrogenophaga intermedia]MCM3564449.1 hypothetical protein [Hydrogenophaga intermedia]